VTAYLDYPSRADNRDRGYLAAARRAFSANGLFAGLAGLFLATTLHHPDVLVGVGPCAELELGEVSRGEWYGVVVEDLDADGGYPGSRVIDARDGLCRAMKRYGNMAKKMVPRKEPRRTSGAYSRPRNWERTNCNEGAWPT
jgi:hypothetical protein